MPGAGHGGLCRIVPHLSEKGYNWLLVTKKPGLLKKPGF